MDAALVRTIDARYGRTSFFANDVGAIGQSLAHYGEWAENEIGFVRHFIASGATVLDVGAYIGTHTLAFARAVGPDGHVIAFEPQPDAFAVLETNVATNGLTNVRLENAVVSDRPEPLTIPRLDVAHEASFGSASLSAQLHAAAGSADVAAGVGTVEVRSVIIDSLGLARCDLLKIDAEGAEDIVLRGALRSIGTLKPVIYAECNSIAEGLRTLEILRAANYAVRLHLVSAFNPDNFLRTIENVFGEAREAALVGVPLERAAELDSYIAQPGELLVRIATPDDLALGLLNKPQYPEEVLRVGVAAADGAAAWLEAQNALRTACEAATREAATALGILARERADFERRTVEAYRGFDDERADFERRTVEAYRGFDDERAAFEQRIAQVYAEMDGVRRELAAVYDARAIELDERRRVEAEARAARTELANTRALVDAAMLQARLARDAADAALKERAKSSQAQSALETRIDLERRGAEAMKQRAADLTAEVDSLRRQLEGVRRSTSWRLTGPLRVAGRFLKGR